ncbi:hypothetical protein [Flavobacterium terrisoli]|uniref:hypothetical protein n=1 Tax=Flavobacterium terrisoli TaxID=3242195 RepID=UPI002542D92D|nr:hypothetical protein [Flavobacterium buctense]
MYSILPSVSLMAVFIFLFFREVKLDHKRYLEAERLADEHILREVERFLKEQHDYESQNTVAETEKFYDGKLSSKRSKILDKYYN